MSTTRTFRVFHRARAAAGIDTCPFDETLITWLIAFAVAFTPTLYVTTRSLDTADRSLYGYLLFAGSDRRTGVVDLSASALEDPA